MTATLKGSPAGAGHNHTYRRHPEMTGLPPMPREAAVHGVEYCIQPIWTAKYVNRRR
ncbi:hypothetical protein PAXINDRAFT_20704 [Paxillus involutus ATCC 200175]|uniref:Uncharacterized protein n=1 Tax=Paxillus involutus ATCC 200175 TaxID=664439 RepID=A0A0C9SUG7_PAXIN|nr:hypothetical protein PAXINDRAFT_20704 [Paxillus involutus ATCC 200175]